MNMQVNDTELGSVEKMIVAECTWHTLHIPVTYRLARKTEQQEKLMVLISHLIGHWGAIGWAVLSSGHCRHSGSFQEWFGIFRNFVSIRRWSRQSGRNCETGIYLDLFNPTGAFSPLLYFLVICSFHICPLAIE